MQHKHAILALAVMGLGTCTDDHRVAHIGEHGVRTSVPQPEPEMITLPLGEIIDSILHETEEFDSNPEMFVIRRMLVGKMAPNDRLPHWPEPMSLRDAIKTVCGKDHGASSPVIDVHEISSMGDLMRLLGGGEPQVPASAKLLPPKSGLVS